MDRILVASMVIGLLGLPVAAEDRAKEPEGPWTPALSAGMNFMQNAQKDWATDGEDSILLGLVLDGAVAYEQGIHRWATSLHVEYGLSKVEGEERRKASDDLTLATEYALGIWERLEPYASAEASSQMDDGFYRFDEATEVTFPDGTTRVVDRVQTSSSFDPLSIQEELGGRYPLWRDEERGFLKAKLALAGRHLVTDEFHLLVEENEQGDPELEPVEAYDDLGISAGLKGELAFSETGKWTGEAAYFAPFDDAGEGITSAKTTLSLGLTRAFSLEALVELLDDPNITEDLQIRESLMLRLSVKLL